MTAYLTIPTATFIPSFCALPWLQADERGNIRVANTRYKAKHLAAEHFHFGWTAEELLRQLRI